MRQRLLSVALLACAGLAGCSEEPDGPGALPQLTASPSASASPSPAPTPTPSGIDAFTPDGAGAFARYWYSQLDLAYSTRDPEPLRRLSAPGCKTCERYIDTVAQLRDSKDRVDISPYVIKAAVAPALEDSAQTVKVTVIYDSDETVFYDSKGQISVREPAEQNAADTLVLTRDAGSWKVAEVRPG